MNKEINRKIKYYKNHIINIIESDYYKDALNDPYSMKDWNYISEIIRSHFKKIEKLEGKLK